MFLFHYTELRLVREIIFFYYLWTIFWPMFKRDDYCWCSVFSNLIRFVYWFLFCVQATVWRSQLINRSYAMTIISSSIYFISYEFVEGKSMLLFCTKIMINYIDVQYLDYNFIIRSIDKLMSDVWCNAIGRFHRRHKNQYYLANGFLFFSIFILNSECAKF